MATKNTTITVSVAGSQNYLPISKTIDVSVIIPRIPLTDIVTSSKLINDDDPIIIYDENSLWKGEPIEWQVIGIDQDGQNTVTLQTDKILTGFAWDSKNNGSDSNRNNYGANRIDSLLHQWLNSDAANLYWYSSRHNNQTPSSSTVYNYSSFGMDSAAAKGFKTNLSDDFKGKLISVTKYVTPYQSGDPSYFTGKLFCPSVREVAPSYTNQYYTPESGAFTYQRFQNNSESRRRKSTVSPAEEHWWLRSPYTNNSYNMWGVGTGGYVGSTSYGVACTTYYGAAPACVLPSNIIIKEDANGKYKIIW